MRGLYGGWAANGYGFPWGGAVWLAVWVGLAALVAFVAFRAGRSRKTELENAKERGIDILIARFSRGELDAEAFKAMKSEIDAAK